MGWGYRLKIAGQALAATTIGGAIYGGLGALGGGAENALGGFVLNKSYPSGPWDTTSGFNNGLVGGAVLQGSIGGATGLLIGLREPEAAGAVIALTAALGTVLTITTGPVGAAILQKPVIDALAENGMGVAVMTAGVAGIAAGVVGVAVTGIVVVGVGAGIYKCFKGSREEPGTLGPVASFAVGVTKRQSHDELLQAV